MLPNSSTNQEEQVIESPKNQSSRPTSPQYEPTDTESDDEDNDNDLTPLQNSTFIQAPRRGSMMNLHKAIHEMMQIMPEEDQRTVGMDVDKEITTTSHAQRVLRQRRSSLVKYAPDSLEAFQRTGDVEMYTKEAIEERTSLRNHPRVLEKYSLWWSTVLELYDHNKDNALDFDEYMEFYGILHAVMLKGTAGNDEQDDEWRKGAKDDWESDGHGENGMNEEKFQDSLHELVDLWTVSTSLDEYVEFLDYTFTRMIELSPQTKFSFWNRAIHRLKLPTYLFRKSSVKRIFY